MKYESRRVTISYPAVQTLVETYGLPVDLPSQTLAGYIEKLIFSLSANKPESLTAKTNH